MSGSSLQNQRGVSVRTSARLHMGFFDLNGGLGRRYGSIGVSLDHPATELHAWIADQFTAEGPNASRVLDIARKLAQALQLQGGMHVAVQQAIPEHAGLGSGTQMSLAVGLALSELHGLGLQAEDVARLTGRGARSGIGVGGFASGGVIIDGGRGPNTLVPPVIAHADFPEAWRILLIMDRTHRGVHGTEEVEAFRNLPIFPATTAERLCRHVLMQALPALAEHDLTEFGKAIRELQERTGDHFAPVQGGRYASRRVAGVLQWLDEYGAPCSGQSSWGPTGFAICENETAAQDLMMAIQTHFGQDEALEFMLCRGLNRGGVISELPGNQVDL
jgi:beta-ribofuranosylaminobenzene 5'-phosphate synthase